MKRQYFVLFVGLDGTRQWLDTYLGWSLRNCTWRGGFGSMGEAKRAARKAYREGKHKEYVSHVEIYLNTCRPGIALFRKFDTQLLAP